MLLKDNLQVSVKVRKRKAEKNIDCPFLDDLKKNTLKSRKTLVFFIVFASFCFSAMTQMSASKNELSSVMMGIMIMLIGLVLACTTLFLAITTVIQGNTKTIAMMRVFGYSQKDCCGALLGGYRPLAYIGFAAGTIYQYALLRIMVDIVFKDVDGVPVYKFDFPAMLISLATFAVIYEIVMYVYSEKIKKISIKEIMLE
jgi:predicted lysophospholipase L1 biosynthesis ABC-type transport system permease subunit